MSNIYDGAFPQNSKPLIIFAYNFHRRCFKGPKYSMLCNASEILPREKNFRRNIFPFVEVLYEDLRVNFVKSFHTSVPILYRLKTSRFLKISGDIKM